MSTTSATPTITPGSSDIVARLEAATERMQRVHKAAGSVIFGHDQVIEVNPVF